MACTGSPKVHSLSPASGLGATPGGAQDIGYARKEIDAGRMPRPDAFLTEGLLSEHDLPVDGAECTAPLCIRPGLVEAPSLASGASELWLHLGMTTSTPREQLKRPPLDLVVAIDKSSSMSIDMRETNAAVAALIQGLDPADRVAIFAFDTKIHEVHPLGPISDTRALTARVKQLGAGGGWEIQPAIDHAYKIASKADGKGRMKRVAVLSCAYPRLGAQREDAFSKAVLSGGEQGIGMTFVGVLQGFHPDLAKLLGDAKGGSFHFADRLETIEKVFATDLDLMMTPVAYDLALSLQLAPGYQVSEVYGLPGNTKSVDMKVATVFFSKNRGAIVARLTRDANASGPAGNVRFAYKPREGAPHDETVPLVPGDAAGARKAVALVNLAEQLRAVATAYAKNERTIAAKLADDLIAYLEPQATDDGMKRELEMVRKVRAIIGPN